MAKYCPGSPGRLSAFRAILIRIGMVLICFVFQGPEVFFVFSLEQESLAPLLPSAFPVHVGDGNVSGGVGVTVSHVHSSFTGESDKTLPKREQRKKPSIAFCHQVVSAERSLASSS